MSKASVLIEPRILFIPAINNYTRLFFKGNQITKSNLLIAVTGTPGSGKTSFAKELQRALPNSKVIEVNDVVDQYKLFSRIDKMGSKVVKLKELEKKVQQLIKDELKSSHLIIVGHLVCELKIKQDMTVVIRIGLNELINRLEVRKYEKEKIKENIVSESVDYCGTKAKDTCKETYEVETDSDKAEIIEYIVSKASGKPSKEPDKKEINKIDEILDLVANGNKYSL